MGLPRDRSGSSVSTDIRRQTNLMSRDQIIRAIAAKHLHVETLEPRNSDSLDFHEVGVVSLRRALEAAYDAGRAESGSSSEPAQSVEPSVEASGEWVSMTVDQARDHLRNWIDEIDDPTHIAALFEPVCGCPRVIVVNGKEIRAELP